MKGLAAILVFVSLIVVAVIALVIVTFAPVLAATRPQGRMQDCTAQWLATGNPDRAAYQPFLRACLAGAVTAPAVRPVALRTPAAPKIRAAHMDSPHKALALKAAANGDSPSPGGNRMKMCGAKWQGLKAANATDGQTWHQFVSQCLRTH